jgi:hypothetical protein
VVAACFQRAVFGGQNPDLDQAIFASGREQY